MRGSFPDSWEGGVGQAAGKPRWAAGIGEWVSAGRRRQWAFGELDESMSAPARLGEPGSCRPGNWRIENLRKRIAEAVERERGGAGIDSLAIRRPVLFEIHEHVDD